MTKTILVTTDCLPAADLNNCVEALNRTLAKWCPKWNLTATATSDPKVKADMVIKVTDTNRHTGAYGYHTVENKIPTAYISPSALLHNVYGTFTPAHWSVAIWNLARTKITRAAKQTAPARYREGIVTVIIHEALEMLADKNLDAYATAPDGKNWLVEVCDHASGFYGTETVNGKVCVIPDATLPNYYSVGSSAPFTTFGNLKTPFDKSAPKFYAFYKDATGKFVAV